ncbi:hypothetical protein HG536_0H00190 [Torulaspora globosa]|uniref:Endonuclease/exonuclease/phosphatase domain-containing protein n=1 Tax=Torulaspora globosa TaxID=48254 RepID=A0A7G3ZMA9_9SACH|nr:uncharacterized protein HG536_0H00190 [Torulaspora globosa]QLL34645.1 hypothetical protein HG536_0H00190 [Torulaspora globosa]
MTDTASDRQCGVSLELGNAVLDQKSENDEVAKKQGKKDKGKRRNRKEEMSPEHVAKVRAEREAARKAKREALIAKGMDPDYPPELQFIRRPMLTLHDGEPTKGFTFRLMTYNCLAQALIRRKLFPDSGDALKWFRRSKVLRHEFEVYRPDVLCLQEIDYIQYQQFWKEELGKLGYDTQFYKQPTKNHGVSIAWQRDLFQMTDRMLIDFDNERSGNIKRRTLTHNSGLILSLRFTDKVKQKYPHNTKCGILIGTSHLFWHPFGTYERTRQCYVVLNKVKEFMKRVNVLQNGNDGNLTQWVPLFCGDFNSQPFDTPYLSMTSKPVEYKGRARTVIECSTSYTFSKLRNGEEEADDEEGGNIEKFGKDQPQTPVPETFTANAEQSRLVHEMQSLHNSLDMRAISLYSVAYNKVHPDNAGLDNKRGEPEMSNWANTWRGLLDYLFLITQWDSDDRRSVDPLDVFEKENSIKIRGLLRMPPSSEMPHHGQPHEGEYASDHLSMMCELEISP